MSEAIRCRRYHRVGTRIAGERDYRIYHLDDIPFYVDSDSEGQVFEFLTGMPERVEEPRILKKIHAQIAEDDETCAARDAYAAELAHGDSVLCGIIRLHMEYVGGRVCAHEEEGVTLYRVGHNSSHDFSVGVKGGRQFIWAFGDVEWDEENDRGISRGELREVADWTTRYVGHF